MDTCAGLRNSHSNSYHPLSNHEASFFFYTVIIYILSYSIRQAFFSEGTLSLAAALPGENKSAIQTV